MTVSATATASRVTLFQLEQFLKKQKVKHEVVREFYPKQADNAVDALAFSVCGRILALGYNTRSGDNFVRSLTAASPGPVALVSGSAW